MPLSLATAACYDLPKRIVWNPTSDIDVREASEKIAALERQGFTIGERRIGETLLYPPEQPEDSVIVRVLDDNGDTRLVWSRKRQTEVEDARKKFNEYVAKGYRAYVCRSDGTKGSKVDNFDSLMQEIILVEEKAAKPAPPPAAKPKAPPKPKPAPRAQGVMVPPTHPG